MIETVSISILFILAVVWLMIEAGHKPRQALIVSLVGVGAGISLTIAAAWLVTT